MTLASAAPQHWIHTSRVAAAPLPHLTQTVIAGLVPAIHARGRLLISLERLGAAAQWAPGTSPRVTAEGDEQRPSPLAPQPVQQAQEVALLRLAEALQGLARNARPEDHQLAGQQIGRAHV